jgi:hypothetical protein
MGNGATFPGVKRAGCEADHSSPSSAEVKNAAAMPPLPHAYLCLINYAQGQLNLSSFRWNMLGYDTAVFWDVTPEVLAEEHPRLGASC